MPYTRPLVRSPFPARISDPEISGSVIPASTVDGSITMRLSP